MMEFHWIKLTSIGIFSGLYIIYEQLYSQLLLSAIVLMETADNI